MSNFAKSLVSIIIPNYNKEEYIKEAIDSALNQTYSPIEVIVVDDGSTDDSRKIIKSYGAKIKAYFLPHSYQSAANNFGFRKSKGKYIQFLDSDDIILPKKIEKQVKSLEETKSDIALCYWQHFYDNGKIGEVKKIPEKMSKRDLFLWILKGNWFNPIIPLYLKSFIDWDGPWDENRRKAVDSDFHFQAALNHPKVVTVKEVLSLYRGTIGRTEARRVILWAEEHFKVYEKILPDIKTSRERELFAASLYQFARPVYFVDNNLYNEILNFALSIHKNFIPYGNKLYVTLFRIFGRDVAEFLSSLKRRIYSRGFKV